MLLKAIQNMKSNGEASEGEKKKHHDKSCIVFIDDKNKTILSRCTIYICKYLLI